MYVPIDAKLNIHVAEAGDPAGAPVLFAHALGLNLNAWEGLLPHLPKGLRLVMMDMRGHGKSDNSAPPYAMGTLVRDAEIVCETLGLRDCVMVGNSIGGIIAQGLAAKRLDLVRALVLAGTAPKIGTRQLWQDRIAAVEDKGMEAIVDWAIERWFSKTFRASADASSWRDTLASCNPLGYQGCAAAIAGTDFYTTTAALRLPALVTAGAEDGATPPDLVRELAELIPGSEFQLIRGSGHLPAIDKPAQFGALLTDFFERIGHV